jgi:hypothetical protein
LRPDWRLVDLEDKPQYLPLFVTLQILSKIRIITSALQDERDDQILLHPRDSAARFGTSSGISRASLLSGMLIPARSIFIIRSTFIARSPTYQHLLDRAKATEVFGTRDCG